MIVALLIFKIINIVDRPRPCFLTRALTLKPLRESSKILCFISSSGAALRYCGILWNNVTVEYRYVLLILAIFFPSVHMRLLHFGYGGCRGRVAGRRGVKAAAKTGPTAVRGTERRSAV